VRSSAITTPASRAAPFRIRHRVQQPRRAGAPCLPALQCEPRNEPRVAIHRGLPRSRQHRTGRRHARPRPTRRAAGSRSAVAMARIEKHHRTQRRAVRAAPPRSRQLAGVVARRSSPVITKKPSAIWFQRADRIQAPPSTSRRAARARPLQGSPLDLEPVGLPRLTAGATQSATQSSMLPSGTAERRTARSPAWYRRATPSLLGRRPAPHTEARRELAREPPHGDRLGR
jgi:hypothetical protein